MLLWVTLNDVAGSQFYEPRHFFTGTIETSVPAGVPDDQLPLHSFFRVILM